MKKKNRHGDDGTRVEDRRRGDRQGHALDELSEVQRAWLAAALRHRAPRPRNAGHFGARNTTAAAGTPADESAGKPGSAL